MALSQENELFLSKSSPNSVLCCDILGKKLYVIHAHETLNMFDT